MLGDTVNTAARLEQATRDLGQEVPVPAGTLHARGRAEPLDIMAAEAV